MDRPLGRSRVRNRRARKAATVSTMVAVLSIALMSPAHGFSYQACSGGKVVNDDNQIRWAGSAVGFQSQVVRDALHRAVARWNNAPGNFTFLDPSFGDHHLSMGNLEDEMWFTSKEHHLDGRDARAWVWDDCTGIHEVDIIYRASGPWSFTDNLTSKSTYGGDLMDWNASTLHEMGHSVGLWHEDDEYNIMGDPDTHTHANGDFVRANVGEDAGDGEVFLYGKRSGNVEDLGVSHWKYGGSFGEYSTHVPTQVYRLSDDKVVANGPYLGQLRRFNVEPGKSFNAEFTYENNGATTQNGVKVGFYISENRLVTTSDRLIGTTFLDLAPGNVATVKRKVTIPADLTLFSPYYLGAIIDPDDVIAETDPSNHAFIPIWTGPSCGNPFEGCF